MTSPSLEDIQDRILDAVHAGEPVDRTALLASHPEHADALRRFFGLLDEIEAAPLVAAAGPSQLGEFEILREIGRGGMGIVYEAMQISLKRRVALKVLPPALRQDSRLLARFRREAEAAARLRHPNVVPVYSVGESAGAPFFAMELVEGRSLRDVILARKEGRDPGVPTAADDFRRWAIDTVARVADALDYVHGRGILHRDIKPGNILIEDDGTPRLTDFGLALDMQASELTLSGEVFGSPMYMSPEQAFRREQPVDARTDIYSLAVTLYELLLLRLPYEGTSQAEVLSALGTGRIVSPRETDAAFPEPLERVLLQALRREPRERYATAGAFASDLRAALRDGGAVLAARPAARAPDGGDQAAAATCVIDDAARRRAARHVAAGALGVVVAALMPWGWSSGVAHALIAFLAVAAAFIGWLLAARRAQSLRFVPLFIFTVVLTHVVFNSLLLALHGKESLGMGVWVAILAAGMGLFAARKLVARAPAAPAGHRGGGFRERHPTLGHPAVLVGCGVTMLCFLLGVMAVLTLSAGKRPPSVHVSQGAPADVAAPSRSQLLALADGETSVVAPREWLKPEFRVRHVISRKEPGECLVVVQLTQPIWPASDAGDGVVLWRACELLINGQPAAAPVMTELIDLGQQVAGHATGGGPGPLNVKVRRESRLGLATALGDALSLGSVSVQPRFTFRVARRIEGAGAAQGSEPAVEPTGGTAWSWLGPTQTLFIYDEYPDGYPRRVSDPETDADFTAAFAPRRLDFARAFSSGPRRGLQMTLVFDRQPELTVPAAFDLELSFPGSSAVLARATLTLAAGGEVSDSEYQNSLPFLLEAPPAEEQRLLLGLESGEVKELRLRCVPSRAAALGQPDFDSYWGGTLDLVLPVSTARAER